MKVYIQDLRTLSYHAESGHWVKTVEEAKVFETAKQAVEHVGQSQMKDVQVVIRFSTQTVEQVPRLKTVGEYKDDANRPLGTRS